MDNTQFWQLIETAKAQGQGKYGPHYAALKALVAALPVEEIVEFGRWVKECRARAYSWDMWAAAFLIKGGCSDDCFEYFCDWVIVQGEAFFNRTIADPGSLVDAPLDVNRPDIRFEGLLGLVMQVYEAQTGQDLPAHPEIFAALRDGPAGERWTKDNVAQRWPQLAVKFDY